MIRPGTNLYVYGVEGKPASEVTSRFVGLEAVIEDGDWSYLVFLRPADQALSEIGIEPGSGQPRETYSDERLLDALAATSSCGESLTEAIRGGYDSPPATCVTAVEARLACQVVGKRLPTPKSGTPRRGGDEALGDRELAEWTMREVHGVPTLLAFWSSYPHSSIRPSRMWSYSIPPSVSQATVDLFRNTCCFTIRE